VALIGKGKEMTIQEAKSFVGTQIEVSWTGRKGDEMSDTVHVVSVGFVPLYGPCLITDIGEICLDRVVHYSAAMPHQRAS
jgi:hypothetical protein